MKKAALITILALLLPLALGAQETEGIQADQIGKDQAQQQLVEISVAKFEDAAFWGDSMPLDMGIASLRRFEGGPAAKKPIEAEKAPGAARPLRAGRQGAMFFKRAANEAFFFPVRPLPDRGHHQDHFGLGGGPELQPRAQGRDRRLLQPAPGDHLRQAQLHGLEAAHRGGAAAHRAGRVPFRQPARASSCWASRSSST